MRRHALPLIAGLVTFITIVSGGVAYALWSVSAEQLISASAAGIGVAMTGSDAEVGLAEGYDEAAGVTVNAGAVTITNTGTREAEYHLVLHPESATMTLPAAIAVEVGLVASVAACAPEAVLTDAQSGALGSGATPADFTYTSAGVPAQLGAGQSVVLCVRTSIAPSAIGAFGATSLDITLTSSLQYADGDAWTATGEPITVTQHVTTADIANLFNGAGRFYLYSAYDANPYGSAEHQVTTTGAYCLAWGAVPIRFGQTSNTGCGAWNDQVRLVQAPNAPEEFMLLRNMNGWDQPDTPRWEYAGTGTDVFLGAPTENADDQRWVIEGRGDGTYRIVVAATHGTPEALCLAHTTLDINPNSAGGSLVAGGMKQVRPAPCIVDGPATHDTAEYRRQGFRFQLIGTPLPPPDLYPAGYTATCSVNNDNTYAAVTWPTSIGYEGETRFRVMWTYHGLDGTGEPFTVPAQSVLPHTNGYSTSLGLYNTTTGIESFWNHLQSYLATNGLPASGDSVTVEMTIEQQITNNDVYRRITAPLVMGFQHLANGDNRLYCGPAPGSTPSPTPTPTATPSPTDSPVADPIAFPASWCTPSSGNYLHLHFPYPAGSTWRVFTWQSGDPAIDPSGTTGRLTVTDTWYENGEQFLKIKEHGSGGIKKWASDHGGGTITGVEVRIYRDLGGGTWEYYAVRPMTFSDSYPEVTCA